MLGSRTGMPRVRYSRHRSWCEAEPRIAFCLVMCLSAPELMRWVKEVLAAMKSFFVEWSCWPLHVPSLAGGVEHNMEGANAAVVPAQTKKPRSLSGGVRLSFGVLGRANLECAHCAHFRRRTWPYRGRIGPDSACFRGCPVFAGSGMQFESHLGHSGSPRQRGFCFNLCTKLVWRPSDAVPWLVPGAAVPMKLSAWPGSEPWRVGSPPAGMWDHSRLLSGCSAGRGWSVTYSCPKVVVMT
jgi:hypothetical protein